MTETSKTPVASVEPTVRGEGGRAWRIDVEKAKQTLPNPTDPTAEVTHAWVINQGKFYGYAVVLHLLEGAQHIVTGSTHELVVLTAGVDPEIIYTDSLNEYGDFVYVQQFALEGSDAPGVFLSRVIELVCDGSIDITDQEAWLNRYGRDCVRPATALERIIEMIQAKTGGKVQVLSITPEDVSEMRRARLDRGDKVDNFGATVGCDCPGCTNLRQAQGHPTGAPDDAASATH